MYIMDMITAALLLIVSICLILISLVILRFTIHFTMSEEYREIGVMKAVGISNRKIRGLYIVKYFGISVTGAVAGFVCSVPFGNVMLEKISKNIIMVSDKTGWLNLICAFGTAAVVVAFSYFCTRSIKRISPIEAIRNGEGDESYAKKGLIHLNRSRLPVLCFLALNDIVRGFRTFFTMILIFTLGTLLILIPVNTANTLESDKLIVWFSMAECDHVISEELFLSSSEDNLRSLKDKEDSVKSVLRDRGIEAKVFQEIMFRMNISKNNRKMSSLAFQGIGDITAEEYVYLEGSAPQRKSEVAISHTVAENIDAAIGDDVEIKDGETVKTYTVTAIFQTMNNMGEGIRFSEKEELDYRYMAGCFGIQIRYQDDCGKEEKDRRKAILKELYAENKVYDAGEYINDMIGDMAGTLGGIKRLILLVVLCINMLVTVLMVKSFLAREKGEIALLKAAGFQNISLIIWQTLRIGIVLLMSVILGLLLLAPVSKLAVEPIFQMMGAYSIEFDVEPFEVYVAYPLLVFLATLLSAFASAWGIKRISASEISSIE